MQVAGKIIEIETIGAGHAKRLIATISDGTGEVDLVWFQGINWVQKNLSIGSKFLVFGRSGVFMNRVQITHPEIELITADAATTKNFLEPVYPSTEKLKTRGLGGKQIGQLTYNLLSLLSEKDLTENLPEKIIEKYKLMARYRALQRIHFPGTAKEYEHAVRRLKFEELFFAHLRSGMLRTQRHHYSKGLLFDKVGDYFITFYSKYLPFELTNAQKKVLREIRKDVGSGKQMNRLLQGDVGSGKTIVALLTMLIAADNGYQSCLMAPTEILAQQHFSNIKELLKDMPVNVALLTGSTKIKNRREILTSCESGELHILLGTHAVIEETVKFKNLGLAIIDEQHRFGVEQRSKLWQKNQLHPHILVMTATPIPRTLALTAYGDLDYSVMDELPPGRQPIHTTHRFESARPQVMNFIRSEIEKGRQVYIIYPLIEESSKVDYENLMKGYEEVKAFFPEPKFWISMVHGKQKSDQKQTNMYRFIKGETQIMVSTTVIEVGVNVPNASVMVIESAEKFGLTQLHQLRGRVGRGAEKSYCILLSGNKLSADARVRLKVMSETNDGFIIAEKDLEIRGPGDVEGTRQSGILSFKIADILKDKIMLEVIREITNQLLQEDPQLISAENLSVKNYINEQKGKTAWSKIS
ncbi:ATP-dependent DNA helicase RecG [soil metagenome]